MAKIKDEQYILLPCNGRPRLNIPRGHIYKVKDRNGNELGWITEQTAKEIYGEGNYYLSGSDAACPLCTAYIVGDLEINLIQTNGQS